MRVHIKVVLVEMIKLIDWLEEGDSLAYSKWLYQN